MFTTVIGIEDHHPTNRHIRHAHDIIHEPGYYVPKFNVYVSVLPLINDFIIVGYMFIIQFISGRKLK